MLQPDKISKGFFALTLLFKIAANGTAAEPSITT
jgi:hypothetical protein